MLQNIRFAFLFFFLLLFLSAAVCTLHIRLSSLHRDPRTSPQQPPPPPPHPYTLLPPLLFCRQSFVRHVNIASALFSFWFASFYYLTFFPLPHHPPPPLSAFARNLPQSEENPNRENHTKTVLPHPPPPPDNDGSTAPLSHPLFHHPPLAIQPISTTQHNTTHHTPQSSSFSAAHAFRPHAAPRHSPSTFLPEHPQQVADREKTTTRKTRKCNVKKPAKFIF